jgi:cob(I)alamin adenosyltransferase
MSISSTKGDDGTSCVIDGKRLPKDHPLFECLGTIDELNAFLGDVKTALHPAQNTQWETIDGIQKELFTISGILAGVKGHKIDADKLTAIVHKLEAAMPPMKGFAVPGASPIAAKLHIARTVCRRSERSLVSLGRMEIIPAEIYRDMLAWFNRLSDLLFLLSLDR